MRMTHHGHMNSGSGHGTTTCDCSCYCRFDAAQQHTQIIRSHVEREPGDLEQPKPQLWRRVTTAIPEDGWDGYPGKRARGVWGEGVARPGPMVKKGEETRSSIILRLSGASLGARIRTVTASRLDHRCLRGFGQHVLN